MSEKCKCGATFSVCALKTVCRIMRRLVGSVVWACNIETVPPPFKRFKLLQWSLCRSRTIIVRNFYPSSICFGQRASLQSGFHSKCVKSPIRQSHWQFPEARSGWRGSNLFECAICFSTLSPSTTSAAAKRQQTPPSRSVVAPKTLSALLPMQRSKTVSKESFTNSLVRKGHHQCHAMWSIICLPNGSIRGKSSAASVGMTMKSSTSDDIRKCGDLCWSWFCKCSSMQL